MNLRNAVCCRCRHWILLALLLFAVTDLSHALTHHPLLFTLIIIYSPPQSHVTPSHTTAFT